MHASSRTTRGALALVASVALVSACSGGDAATFTTPLTQAYEA